MNHSPARNSDGEGGDRREVHRGGRDHKRVEDLVEGAKHTPMGILTRGVSGIASRTLIEVFTSKLRQTGSESARAGRSERPSAAPSSVLETAAMKLRRRINDISFDLNGGRAARALENEIFA